MSPLLPFNSPLYLRRMAVALRAEPDGFYYEGHRCRSASFTGGWLRIAWPHETELRGTHSRSFCDLTDVVFSDAYGREIVAHRKTPATRKLPKS